MIQNPQKNPNRLTKRNRFVNRSAVVMVCFRRRSADVKKAQESDATLEAERNVSRDARQTAADGIHCTHSLLTG